MNDNELKLLAAERKTELAINERCLAVIKSVEYIDENSHVTARNVVEMQQVIALLENAEFYVLQAQLMLITITKK